MEAKVAQLQEELDSAPVRKPTESVDWIPRGPEKFALTGHRGSITKLVFHPVFALLASASEDATVRLWDYETGKYERSLKGHTNAVQDVAFDGKGNFLASCSADLSIKVWDYQNDFQCSKTLFGHNHNISAIVFSPNGDQLISCSRDRSIKMWEVSTGYCIKTLQGHDDWVRTIDVSEDGASLVSGGNDQVSGSAKVFFRLILTRQRRSAFGIWRQVNVRMFYEDMSTSLRPSALYRRPLLII